jgi:hypothetical protein
VNPVSTSTLTPLTESGASLQRLARTAGLLFLLLLVLGPFSIMYVPGQLLVEGDATTTAANVIESENLLRSLLVPPILGVLVVVAASGYLIDSFANLILPQLADLTSVLVVVTSVIGELPLFLWLLVRGVRSPAETPQFGERLQ